MNTELEALLATAEDTHRVDYVEIPVFDRETGELSTTRRIRVRGATLVEQARFFMRFPSVFDVISKQFDGEGDEDDVSPQAAAALKKKAAENMKEFVMLVLQIPEAASALCSCFVGEPFKQSTEEGLSKLSSDASFAILERGLFKSFDGDIQGFFAKKGGALGKAMGLTRKATSSKGSSKTANDV